jgi:monothiol glutaredoxin
MEVMERIQKQVDSAAIVLYMKGTPQFPQCGFSATDVVSH